MDMHATYQAACGRQLNVVGFSRLAAAVSVVAPPLEEHQTKFPSAIERLDVAMETLLAGEEAEARN